MANDADSVLNSMKHTLDIASDDTSFDVTIVMHINTVLSDLYQIGLGAYGSDELSIEDASDEWGDILPDQKNINMIKSYMTLRIRLLFDPPEGRFSTQSFESQIAKMEYRIRAATSSLPNPQEV